jgi:hypothetical protein
MIQALIAAKTKLGTVTKLYAMLSVRFRRRAQSLDATLDHTRVVSNASCEALNRS